MKSSLDKATEDYHAEDRQYINILLRYSLLLITADLAVAGFLLQNSVTQNIMHVTGFKYVYFLSLLFAACAVIFTIIYKRISRSYELHSMRIEQYAAFDAGSVYVLKKDIVLEGDFKAKIGKTGKTMTMLSKILKINLVTIEALVVASFTLGLAFTYLLIKNT